MSENHTLNKEKVEDFLKRRGWKRGPHKEWITPSVYEWNQAEKDWIDAILQGIECKFEQSKKETEEFLKKHPTPKR